MSIKNDLKMYNGFNYIWTGSKALWFIPSLKCVGFLARQLVKFNALLNEVVQGLF